MVELTLKMYNEEDKLKKYEYVAGTDTGILYVDYSISRPIITVKSNYIYAPEVIVSSKRFTSFVDLNKHSTFTPRELTDLISCLTGLKELMLYIEEHNDQFI